MALGKKGIFFTLIAIILASIVIASFMFYSTYRAKSKMFVVEARVKTMSRFVDDLEKDVQRALYISGFRSILGAEDYIIASGLYVDDAGAVLEELALNGTIYGEAYNLTMDSSLSAWFESVQHQGSKIGLELDYEVLDFEVSQSGPWSVDFYASIFFEIRDSKDLASWDIVKNVSSSVDITGFEDPVYTIGSYGRTTRIVNKTMLEVKGIDELKDFLDEMSYRAYAGAPSFLMRLEGDLGASPYGIETLVNTNELSYYDLFFPERSSVDYIYFGEQSTTDYKVYNITDAYMPGFRLDEEHVDEYDVDDFKYS